MTASPPNLDAILESIRARMTGESEAAPLAAPPAVFAQSRPAKLLKTPLTTAPGVTVEALLTAVLEPLLRQWLDAHLPEICERAAIAEIRRLTGQPEPQPEAQP